MKLVIFMHTTHNFQLTQLNNFATYLLSVGTFRGAEELDSLSLAHLHDWDRILVRGYWDNSFKLCYLINFKLIFNPHYNTYGGDNIVPTLDDFTSAEGESESFSSVS